MNEKMISKLCLEYFEDNDQIVDRLNNIYDLLWNEWSEMCHV